MNAGFTYFSKGEGPPAFPPHRSVRCLKPPAGQAAGPATPQQWWGQAQSSRSGLHITLSARHAPAPTRGPREGEALPGQGLQDDVLRCAVWLSLSPKGESLSSPPSPPPHFLAQGLGPAGRQGCPLSPAPTPEWPRGKPRAAVTGHHTETARGSATCPAPHREDERSWDPRAWAGPSPALTQSGPAVCVLPAPSPGPNSPPPDSLLMPRPRCSPPRGRTVTPPPVCISDCCCFSEDVTPHVPPSTAGAASSPSPPVFLFWFFSLSAPSAYSCLSPEGPSPPGASSLATGLLARVSHPLLRSQARLRAHMVRL